MIHDHCNSDEGYDHVVNDKDRYGVRDRYDEELMADQCVKGVIMGKVVTASER